jgi:hypothetical protein
MRLIPEFGAVSVAFALAGCGSPNQPAATHDTGREATATPADQNEVRTDLTDAKSRGEARARADMQTNEKLDRAFESNKADGPADQGH